MVEENTDVDAVLEERGTNYGSFEGTAGVAQEVKAIISKHLYARGKTLRVDQQEALDLIATKLGRIVNGDPDYVDNWIDIAGYAKLVADRLEGRSR
jgi:hypothetical protein